jgi:hypothetical protein
LINRINKKEIENYVNSIVVFFQRFQRQAEGRHHPTTVDREILARISINKIFIRLLRNCAMTNWDEIWNQITTIGKVTLRALCIICSCHPNQYQTIENIPTMLKGCSTNSFVIFFTDDINFIYNIFNKIQSTNHGYVNSIIVILQCFQHSFSINNINIIVIMPPHQML